MQKNLFIYETLFIFATLNIIQTNKISNQLKITTMNKNQLFDKVCEFEEAYEKQNPQIDFISGTQYEEAYKAFAEKYGKQVTPAFLDLLEAENFHTCRRVLVEWFKKNYLNE